MVRSGPADGRPVVLLLATAWAAREGDLAGLVPFLPSDFAYVSLRGIYRYVQGYAWFEMPMRPSAPRRCRPPPQRSSGGSR